MPFIEASPTWWAYSSSSKTLARDSNKQLCQLKSTAKSSRHDSMLSNRADTFHLFPLLPAEIRRMIWNLCLPRRVTELNPALGHQLVDDCVFWETWAANAAPPILTRVCRESRYFAYEKGHLLDEGEYGLEGSRTMTWVQPELDALHVNWDRSICEDEQGEPSPVAIFLRDAHKNNLQPSISSEMIYQLITPAIEEEPYFDRVVGPDEKMSDIKLLANSVGGPCFVIMSTIVVHVEDEEAIKSGLFGRLGEELVQLVDYDDVETLKKYRDLYGPATHRDTRTMFWMLEGSMDCTQMMVKWLKEARFIMMASLWLEERNKGFPANPKDNVDASLAWVPFIDDDESPRLSVHHLNEHHPWVIKVSSQLPILKPKIEMRHCFNRCNKYSRKWLSPDPQPLTFPSGPPSLPSRGISVRQEGYGGKRWTYDL